MNEQTIDDLVRRQDALELYDDPELQDSHYKVPIPVIVQNLKDLPAVEARHLVYGYYHDEYQVPYATTPVTVTCSACKEHFLIDATTPKNFCPNCGATLTYIR